MQTHAPMADRSNHWKFGIGIAVIVGVALWGAVSGFRQSKMYYVTVQELVNNKVARQHVRVGGTVEKGSITRRRGTLWFRLSQNAETIPVVYVGTGTLPDTFKGGAQAIVQGNYTSGGAFQADQIQAKCASKYVAAPPGPQNSNVAKATGWAKRLSDPATTPIKLSER